MHCRGGEKKGEEKEEGRVAYPLREVHFEAEDTNILRTGALNLRVEDGEGGRGESGRGGFDSHCGVKEEERNREWSGR